MPIVFIGMDPKTRIHVLLDKFTSNLCSREELDELFGYLSTGNYDELLDEHILGQLRGVTPDGVGLDAGKALGMVDTILSGKEVKEEKSTRPEHAGAARLEHAGTARVVAIRRRIVWAAAAACILAAAITTTIWKTNKRESSPAVTLAYEKQSLRRLENTGSVNKAIVLEDGSHVELFPGAVLTYPEHFAGDRRELSLEGDAWFDVAKNPDKPFMIYHQQLITRVLGTSFIIKGSKTKQEVQVITGKVEVYENVKGREGKKSDGVIVTPNEKVTYSEDKPFFHLALVDSPVLVEVKKPVAAGAEPLADAFDFDQASLRTIIGQLHDAYGIQIEVESENINNCVFSGDISDMGLYQKLDIICKAMGMSYEVKGTRILLNGKGCK